MQKRRLFADGHWTILKPAVQVTAQRKGERMISEEKHRSGKQTEEKEERGNGAVSGSE